MGRGEGRMCGQRSSLGAQDEHLDSVLKGQSWTGGTVGAHFAASIISKTVCSGSQSPLKVTCAWATGDWTGMKMQSGLPAVSTAPRPIGMRLKMRACLHGHDLMVRKAREDVCVPLCSISSGAARQSRCRSASRASCRQAASSVAMGGLGSLAGSYAIAFSAVVSGYVAPNLATHLLHPVPLLIALSICAPPSTHDLTRRLVHVH